MVVKGSVTELSMSAKKRNAKLRSNQTQEDRKLVKRCRIEDSLDISRSTLYRMMANDEFPHPIYLPGGGARWVWDEVMAWAEERIQKRS